MRWKSTVVSSVSIYGLLNIDLARFDHNSVKADLQEAIL